MPNEESWDFDKLNRQYEQLMIVADEQRVALFRDVWEMVPTDFKPMAKRAFQFMVIGEFMFCNIFTNKLTTDPIRIDTNAIDVTLEENQETDRSTLSEKAVENLEILRNSAWKMRFYPLECLIAIECWENGEEYIPEKSLLKHQRCPKLLVKMVQRLLENIFKKKS